MESQELTLSNEYWKLMDGLISNIKGLLTTNMPPIGTLEAKPYFESQNQLAQFINSHQVEVIGSRLKEIITFLQDSIYEAALLRGIKAGTKIGVIKERGRYKLAQNDEIGVEEFARLSRRHKNTIRNWIKNGTLKSREDGKGFHIKRSELSRLQNDGILPS